MNNTIIPSQNEKEEISENLMTHIDRKPSGMNSFFLFSHTQWGTISKPVDQSSIQR